MKELIINFWPQLTVLTLMILNLIKDFFNEGKTINSTNNVITLFLMQSFYIFLYWKGGFYSEIHAPQVIHIIFTICAFGVMIYGNFKPDSEKVGSSVIYSLIGNALYLWFLNWAGFFTGLLNAI